MPVYIYKCKKCEVARELEHKINDFVIPSCPKCLGQMRKTIVHRVKKKENRDANI